MTFNELYQCKAIRDVQIPMRDSVNLSAFLLLPESAGQVPAVLLRTPYIKEKINNEPVYHDFILKAFEQGYAIVIQDVRGTGKSEGVLLSNGGNEADDGYDTIEWIAVQPWCNGRIGMFGLSYFGFTQMAAASKKPPHLFAICPFQNASLYPFSISAANTYNSFHLMWLYGRVLDRIEYGQIDPDQAEKIRREIKKYSENWAKTSMFLPARSNPAAEICGLSLLHDYVDLVDGVEDSRYWEQAGRPVPLSEITVPMFHLTGWYDMAKDGVFQNYYNICENGSNDVNESSRLVIGPWTHGGVLSGTVDGMDFGEENSGRQQGVPDMMLKWFDRWLKEEPNTLDAWKRVRYFEIGSNQWKEDDCWPPKNSSVRSWYLHGKHGEKEGFMDQEMPGNEAPDIFTYDPEDPLPSSFTDSSGKTLLADPTILSARSDVLTFRTDQLTAPLEICGKVKLRLYAATSAPDTDFFARLVDVDEQGHALPLLSGIIRCRFRNGRKAEFLEPGNCYLFTIDLGDIAVYLPAGHQILLQISSSDYPANDRNLNTTERIGWGTQIMKAQQTVFHESKYPSYLELPVISGSET